MTFNPLGTPDAVSSAKPIRDRDAVPSARGRSSAPFCGHGARRRRETPAGSRSLADILLGKLEPGRQLCMRELARDYATSTTSVRQVLTELTRDRLVVSTGSGYEVAPASQTELLELTQTAYWLGDVGLRESIRQGDRQWEENVLRTCRAVELAADPAASAERTPPSWVQMLAFYDGLVERAARRSSRSSGVR